jgi:hypothetical protein
MVMRLLVLRLRAQHPGRPTARSQRAGLDHLLRIAAEQAAAPRQVAPGAVTADAVAAVSVAAVDDPDGTPGTLQH